MPKVPPVREKKGQPNSGKKKAKKLRENRAKRQRKEQKPDLIGVVEAGRKRSSKPPG